MCLLSHLPDRAAEIDVHNAYLVFMRQACADACEGGGVVVPDLHRQRPWFVLNAPESIGMFAARFVHPDEAFRVDHLRSLQASSAIISDDLSKRIVSETRHGCLQDWRVDADRADFDRSGGDGRTCRRVRIGM